LDEVIDKRVDLDWIKKEALRLVKNHWHIDYIPNIEFDILSQEEWDNWMKVNYNEDKSLWGLYRNSTKTIEFNTETNTRLDLKTIKDVLLHELCHWYLHHKGLPYRDADVRFGHELIRVGLKPNTTPSHTNAYKQARSDRGYRTFELIDNGEDKVVTRLYHPRKNKVDFARDLIEVCRYLKENIEKFKNGMVENLEYEMLYSGEIAGILTDKYGYKREEYPSYSIILGDEYGDIDEDELEWIIDRLESEL